MLLTLGRCNPWISSAQSDFSVFGVFCIISRSLLEKELIFFHSCWDMRCCCCVRTKDGDGLVSVHESSFHF